jgi:hypothetical protein
LHPNAEHKEYEITDDIFNRSFGPTVSNNLSVQGNFLSTRPTLFDNSDELLKLFLSLRLYLLAPPASGETMQLFLQSGIVSLIHFRTAGSA